VDGPADNQGGRWVPLVLFAVLACAGVRVTTDTYATLDEARQAGAVQHAWLPEGLPPGTNEIRVAHLGDGRQWGLFSFPAAESASLRALLGDELTRDVPPCDPPGRLEWWPRLLRSRIDPDAARATGLQLYATKSGRISFAINWNQGRAYFWRG
jgi:hypothetical protein